MSISTGILAHHWAFAVFGVASFAIAGIMLLGGWLLGGRRAILDQDIPFESGIDPVGTARLRFSAKFYLIAMFFVIFDVEVLYLYAWSVSLREVGFLGLIEASIFIFVLLIGLVYLVKIGALDWIPERSRRKLVNKIPIQNKPNK